MYCELQSFNNVSPLNHTFLILPGHLKTLEDRPICPSLEDFSFTRWTPEQVRLFLMTDYLTAAVRL